MRKLFFLFMIPLFTFSQNEKNQFVTISGFVSDVSNSEHLIGVNIYLDSLNLGTTTNSFGFYSLMVPVGNISINFSQLSAALSTQSVTLQANNYVCTAVSGKP